MKYNRCGKSGLLLPAVSLGLWHNFGSVDVYENSKNIIFHAFDCGITHFDLANNYGPIPGSAEITFGNVLKDGLKTHRDEIVVSTKAGYKMWDGPYGDWGSRKYMIASLDQSLKRMGLDYVDIYYSHRPDPETPIEETMMALDQMVRQGKALYVGISNYNPEQSKKAFEILKELRTPCLIHQSRYNMFDRWVENGLLEVTNNYGVGVIAFSPLAQGLLTNRYLNGIPQGSRMTKSEFLKPSQLTNKKLTQITKLNQIAEKRGQSLADMALAWILRDKRITSVLVGASSVEQLDTNLKCIDNVNFTETELQEIDNILNS
ncbi:MAG: aldo/keto reductase [Bacteroidales bacterium]|nr:aldo/keto reductase [Bacteroidales bacterium]